MAVPGGGHKAATRMFIPDDDPAWSTDFLGASGNRNGVQPPLRSEIGFTALKTGSPIWAPGVLPMRYAWQHDKPPGESRPKVVGGYHRDGHLRPPLTRYSTGVT